MEKHKEHRESIKLEKKYKTGPSRRKCSVCPRLPLRKVKLTRTGHECWDFKDDLCVGCGQRMKRGLGSALLVE